MSGLVEIHGVAMTVDAAQAVAETRTDVREDVRRIITGEITPDELLAECIDGADADREAGWREYVDAVDVATSYMLAHPASDEEIAERTRDNYRKGFV